MIRNLVALLVAGVVAAAPAVSDAQTKRSRRKAAEPPAAQLTPEQRAKVRQRVRALRAWKLTEALNLDEATAAKLFPVLDSFDDKFVEAMREGAELRGRLRKAIEGGGRVDDAAVNRIVDAMLANQRRIWELNEQRFAAVRKVLSPVQAAKALVVLPQVDHAIRRHMREALERHRKGRRGGPGRRGPHGFGGPGGPGEHGFGGPGGPGEPPPPFAPPFAGEGGPAPL
ncbi:MAG: periplasmic heavy metal sensor [Deltaproteobacteria bacterium]|nr:MAG: periplasmic heavy metal sensor [Deltaproteobacteria bacterium]